MPLTIGDISKANELKTPVDVLSYDTSVEAIKGAVVYIAQEYGLNRSQFYQTIKCESNFNANAVGDSGEAYGIAQFHRGTFDRFCDGNYYYAKDQLVCMAEMFQKGLQRHWSCWSEYFSN